MAMSVVVPPTRSCRSRPPTPIACEMPRPACAIRHVTSCVPVPEAPTTPMSPRGTRLAKANGTPLRIAVPQSGPMTSRPSARPSRFRAASSSSGTLSLKIMTWSPARSALRASAAAKSPGTEMMARLASGMARRAARSVCGHQCAPAPPAWRGRSSRRSASASAARAAASSTALTPTIRSLLCAARPVRVSRPARSMIPLFDGVPIISAASSTPGSPAMVRDSRIRATESR